MTTGRYTVVMPVRDEERFLPAAIQSLANQTLLPTRCVIVNDGSSDRTGDIAQRAADEYEWISVVHVSDRGFRRVGKGVMDAFYAGYATVSSEPMDFICKLDADITLKPGYFARLFEYFAKDPRLGGASGKVYTPLADGRLVEERMAREMVAGMVKVYRRKAFDDFGGFIREKFWDGFDIHHARMAGWGTTSIDDPELQITHHRLMGSSDKNIVRGRLRLGANHWFMGTHPIYIGAVATYRVFERPFFIGGMLILLGYFLSMARGEARYADVAFRRSLHDWQLTRLRESLTPWLGRGAN